MSKAWIKSHRARLDEDAVAKHGDELTALFHAAIGESRSATELLAGSTMTWSRCQSAADFSYRVRELTGEGWMAVGDAGGFIDPLFSTGAHIAMCGGKLAADTLLEIFAAQASGAEIDESYETKKRKAWEATVRAGAETFILAVQAFYAGPLMEAIFAENKHNALRRSITSLLAGDVFTDAVWLRDTKLRLREMASAPPTAT